MCYMRRPPKLKFKSTVSNKSQILMQWHTRQCVCVPMAYVSTYVCVCMVGKWPLLERVLDVPNRACPRDQSETIAGMHWDVRTLLRDVDLQPALPAPNINNPGWFSLYLNVPHCTCVNNTCAHFVHKICTTLPDTCPQAPTLSPLPTIRKASQSPRRLSQKHSIFVSPHTRECTFTLPQHQMLIKQIIGADRGTKTPPIQ